MIEKLATFTVPNVLATTTTVYHMTLVVDGVAPF